MTTPITVKTWNISPCNRIPFVSLLGTMGAYLLGVKNWLVSHGYTVKGSCNGTTGAMDAVDRWVTAADVATRATIAGAAQSWIVLTDANGANTLFAYQGASDDVARISFSPLGDFVAAGTPAQQPTAVGERVIASGLSLITNTASGDRLWSGWVTSDSKMFRMAIARAGVWAGRHVGVELFTSIAVSPMTLSPAVWGFVIDPAASTVGNGTTVGVTRPIVSGSGVAADMKFGIETFGNSSTLFTTVKPEAQGATGYPAFPLSIGSSTTGARGKFGDLIDAWQGRTTGASDGDTYVSATFIAMGGYNGSGSGMWPWDGSTPVMT